MDVRRYQQVYARVCDAGYADEIEWARSLMPCATPMHFALEAMWVILNSGLKNQVAREIEQRIHKAINRGDPVSTAFAHKGKVRAIQYIMFHRQTLFKGYLETEDKLTYLQTLPWIGPITKYHLAKNLGLDVVKPDRHLVRIARKEGKTPLQLCKDLSELTGNSLAVVDTVLWRAANLGFM